MSTGKGGASEPPHCAGSALIIGSPHRRSQDVDTTNVLTAKSTDEQLEAPMRGAGHTPTLLRALGAALVLLFALRGIARAADDTGSDCLAHSSAPCWRSFELPGGAGHM